MGLIRLYWSSITSTLKASTNTRRLKDLLQVKVKTLGIQYEEVDVAGQPEKLAEMQALTGLRVVPVLLIGQKGYDFDTVQDLVESEELDDLLRA
jgi:glutaredoxin